MRWGSSSISCLGRAEAVPLPEGRRVERSPSRAVSRSISGRDTHPCRMHRGKGTRVSGWGGAPLFAVTEPLPGSQPFLFFFFYFFLH